jgi:hypothetical protein
LKASLTLAALAVSVCSTFAAHAQTTAPAPADIETHKAAILAHIDQRTSEMAAMRNCVAASASKADLKSCHQQVRAAKHAPHAPA